MRISDVILITLSFALILLACRLLGIWSEDGPTIAIVMAATGAILRAIRQEQSS